MRFQYWPEEAVGCIGKRTQEVVPYERVCSSSVINLLSAVERQR